MKRYEKYKPSGIQWIGEIPEHWELKKLKYLTKNYDAKRIPLSSDQRGIKQGEYPYFGATGIIDYIDEYIFDGNYVLVGEDGAPFFIPNRDVAYKATGKFWVNNHAHILKCTDGISEDILVHQLNLVDYRQYVTGSTRDKLTQGDLAEITLIEIPKEEQTVITNYLNEKTAQIDNLIRNKQKLIELLEEERTAIINQAVKQGMDPNVKLKASGIEWLGYIPAHWEVKKLKYVASLKSGESITADSIRQEDEYPVYGGNGLRGFTSEYSHEGEFILIGRQGALCGNINYAKGKFWASEHAVVVSRFNKEDIIWLGELLRVMNLNQYSMSAAQPGLSVERIQNLRIPYPSLEEQQEIGNHIENQNKRIDSTINKIDKEIELLQEYRTALIAEVVTGKIKVV